MKLLHAIRSVDPTIGGPVENLKQFTSAMAGMGHSTEVVTLDSPDAPWISDLKFPVYGLGPGRGLYGYSSRLVPWLREHASSYDAVIVRGIWQYHSFACWRALHRSGTPYFVFPHGMLDPWFKHEYPLKHAKKWLYWPWAEYRVLRDAKAVFFTCEEERLLARRSFCLYTCNEVVVEYGTAAPSGNTQVQKEAFFSLYPELRGKRLALFLGRIHPKKGCDLLIDAFAEVLAKGKEWRLVIAGPDQTGWQAQLATRAREKGIAETMTWTGMISGDVKYGALKAAEVFVLPSHQENFGIVVAEALACGTPVLISNKVNIWREVDRDRAGLVAPDDFEGTCSLLHSWTGLSRTARERMKDRALKCFQNRFEITNSAASIIASVKPFIRTASPSGPVNPRLPADLSQTFAQM
jgi:glycosyltransferase involved in cell wall biosynthesis